MRYAGLTAFLVLLGGCSGRTESASWEIRTDFTLTEIENGGTFQAGTGLYFKVMLAEEDGEGCWTLSYYDPRSLSVVDRLEEQTQEGLKCVWVFRAEEPGEDWLGFDYYQEHGGDSTRSVRYFMVVR